MDASSFGSKLSAIWKKDHEESATEKRPIQLASFRHTQVDVTGAGLLPIARMLSLIRLVQPADRSSPPK